MARTRIIWGKWDCSQCDTKGISAEPPPGEKQPKCPHCGSPREQQDGEEAYLDNARAASGRVLNANVADTREEIDIATAGADWTCKQCSGDNRAREKNCTGCGAPRYEPVRPADTPADEFKQVRARYAQRAPTQPPKPPPPPRSFDVHAEPSRITRTTDWRGPAAIAAAVLGLCMLIGFIWWAATTHDEAGQVTGMAWKHHIHRETYTRVSAEDWEDDIRVRQPVMPVNGKGESPGAFDVRSCRSKKHHDRRYECGTERKCEDKTRQVKTGTKEKCTTRSNDNGSFTESCRDVPVYKTEHYEDCRNVTKYCTEPIYKDWCTYSTYEWRRVDTVTTTGTDPSKGTQVLPWPQVTPDPLDRLVREEWYEVSIDYGGGKTTENPRTQAEFLKWYPGERVTVVVRNIGSVSEVRHGAP